MALERIGNKDLLPDAWLPLKSMGWNTRVQAGRCACLCAEKDAINVDKAWTRQHLPTAIERLKLALQAAPGHEPLQMMTARAEQLLEQANAGVEQPIP